MAAISGVIKICNAVLTHSYHVAIFALENKIPTLLFAQSEYYQLKAEALRTAFGIPFSLLALPDMAPDAIAERFDKLSRSSWSRGMTSADIDEWLQCTLTRDVGTTGASSLARLDRPELDMAG